MKFQSVILCALLVWGCTAEARSKFKTPSKKQYKARKTLTQLRKHPNRVSCGLGVHIFEESGLTIGQQVGFPVTDSGRWFVGPEYHFSLFSTGKLLNIAVGTWYDIPFSDAPRALGITLGTGLGIAFAEKLPRLGSTGYVAFMDLAVFQAINRFTRVRGTVRGEWISGLFTIVTNFNVVFRF